MRNASLNEVLKHVIFWLQANNITPTKIGVQKFIFFLQEKKVIPDYNFESYAYGPFSRQVREAAGQLEENGEIEVGPAEYRLKDAFKDTLSIKEKQEIDEHLEQFVEMLGNNTSFKNLEVYGTALYCIRALEENGLPVDEAAVKEEFQAWKGKKYSDDAIAAAYNRLSSVFG